MPADIGEMFHTGETPWHGLGIHLAKPATVEEALRAGGLDWQVDEVDLMTADHPPSPVPKRKAIVRLDRPLRKCGVGKGKGRLAFAICQRWRSNHEMLWKREARQDLSGLW